MMKNHDMKEKLESFRRLLQIMDELREKCPWDRKQTFETLRNLTIEETYELADAILNNNMDDIRKELGDLMLHLVFYAKIGSETNDFDIKSILDTISDKLIFRHPHIFGDTDVKNNPEIVKKNWEELKMREGNHSVLGGVPKSLPAMVKANRIQDKVSAVGFDWDLPSQIWDKIQEEMNEFKEEIVHMDKDKMVEEFGDLMFSIINAARLYQIDPETALEKTNKKFMKRFEYLETRTLKKGKKLERMTLEEMNNIWEEAKKLDR